MTTDNRNVNEPIAWMDEDGFASIFDKSGIPLYALPEGYMIVPIEPFYEINEWSKAYPLDLFPDPDFKKAAKVLKEAGMTIDSISAANMRHVILGVVEILKEAMLKAYQPDKQEEK